MPSADQVPVKNTHSTMRWPKWVVLIAGSTGSALRAVRPPNLHITPDVRRDLVYRACVDGSGLAREIFTSQAWSVLPCVRPLSAVHMTAGHNALRGSGPGQNRAFEMRWHKWVVLIAGSTGSALRAVRPPNLHITPDVRRDLVYRASATGFLYRSPLAITAQAIRAILLASAMAATLVGRRPNNAVSQGRCPIPWILA